MTNRNSLLGRSRPADRLSKADREALERATAEPAPTQAPTKPEQAKTAPAQPAPAKAAPAGNTAPPANVGRDGTVRQDQLKFHWTSECPACGFKVAGSGNPQPGQRLARCGRCKLNIFLKGK